MSFYYAINPHESLFLIIHFLAWERGLGCVWKSGGLNYNPLFIEGIGLTRGQRIVGILHIGYFDKAPEGKARTPITEKMEIIEG